MRFDSTPRSQSIPAAESETVPTLIYVFCASLGLGLARNNRPIPYLGSEVSRKLRHSSSNRQLYFPRESSVGRRSNREPPITCPVSSKVASPPAFVAETQKSLSGVTILGSPVSSQLTPFLVTSQTLTSASKCKAHSA